MRMMILGLIITLAGIGLMRYGGTSWIAFLGIIIGLIGLRIGLEGRKKVDKK